ncbi:hypothetical protein KKB41_00930 [Patescibacteria group bacterium]|nr:hypothetical protein [Patescibacteria group bacterium]
MLTQKKGGVFKKIGILFVSSILVLFFIVMYMALSRATIVIEPKEETISADLFVTVKSANLTKGDILGKMATTTISREASYTVSGDDREVPAKAEGEVIIYNKYGKDQQLIATTRFLSDNGVLFRLVNGINVPAGKSVTALIRADSEGKEGEVAISHFTIPGLSNDLQKYIYGESEKVMTGGTKKVAALTQEAIDEAVDNLKLTLITEAKEKLKDKITLDSTFVGIAYSGDIKDGKISAKPGDTVDSFKVSIIMDVVGIAYSKDLEEQAAKTLAGIIYSDRKLTSSNLLSLQPEVETVDLEAGAANMKVAIEGKTIINSNSQIFDKEKMAGMSAEEVKEYLSQYAGVESVEIKFFPFWLDKVPKLRDHIKVVVR